MATDLILNVVTPERAIVTQTTVGAVVLPTEMGQVTLLPGHINFVTALRLGTFGYRVGSEWSVAFLAGGFTQVADGVVTVLAETLEMAQELDLSKAELELEEVTGKLKATKVGSSEYAALVVQQDMAKARLTAAKKKLH